MLKQQYDSQYQYGDSLNRWMIECALNWLFQKLNMPAFLFLMTSWSSWTDGVDQMWVNYITLNFKITMEDYMRLMHKNLIIMLLYSNSMYDNLIVKPSIQDTSKSYHHWECFQFSQIYKVKINTYSGFILLNSTYYRF